RVRRAEHAAPRRTLAGELAIGAKLRNARHVGWIGRVYVGARVRASCSRNRQATFHPTTRSRHRCPEKTHHPPPTASSLSKRKGSCAPRRSTRRRIHTPRHTRSSRCTGCSTSGCRRKTEWRDEVSPAAGYADRAMLNREPEPWESGATGPFLRIEDSPVEVWALGEDRFAVRAPGHEQLVTGFEEAR